MSSRQWETAHLNESGGLKRTHDGMGPTPEGRAGVAPTGETSSGAYNAAFQWEGKQIDQPLDSRPSWDSSVQTSLWLARQNSLIPTTPENFDENHRHSHARGSEGQSSRSFDTAEGSMAKRQRFDAPTDNSRERLRGEPMNFGYELHGPNYHLLAASAPRTADREHAPAAPQATKSANIPSLERDCDKCLDGIPLVKDTVDSLSKLTASLTVGILSQVNMKYREEGVPHERVPQVPELHRMFELLGEANQLAKRVDQSASALLRGVVPGGRSNDLNSSLEVMKHRFLSNTQDVPRRNLPSNAENMRLPSTHNRPATLGGELIAFDANPRGSSIETPSSERLPPIRSGTPSGTPIDSFGSRLPSMNPPPAPRHVPSPPRSRRSSPPYNLPSPKSMNYPPSAASTSGIPSAVPPLSPTSSTIKLSPAIQAHTAALQHEVSIKTFALATLQIEHDKLLAALSRSKTRARALEEKQVASDMEVNTLSEDRVRLLQQIAELEEAVEDMKCSRDEYRDAAVNEGKQYVEIVKRASKLEEQAGKEKKEWMQRLRDASASQDANREGVMRASIPSKDEAKLKAETDWLRQKCDKYKALLLEIQNEKKRADEAAERLRTSGDRISDFIRSALVEDLE